MTTVSLFQWVQLKQNVPNSPIKAGNSGVVLDHLCPTKTQQEPGYILEIFIDGEPLDVVSVHISWVNPLPETWRSIELI
ncbi:MAG: hypothetical protein V7L20_27320 [Nostoc sp.]|uniref:hypothetical protein n=1 Tax=Nostoc sp. TaxID=1180 RepID=UPI002FF861D3